MGYMKVEAVEVETRIGLRSDQVDRIKAKAAIMGISPAMVISRALDIDAFMDGIEAEGGKILYVGRRGKFRQIIRNGRG